MQAILFDEEWDEDDLYLAHVGTPHEGNIPHSGRYPYGSGENAYQRAYEWNERFDKLKAKGLSEKEIAAEMGVFDKFGNPYVKGLRAKKSIATNAVRAYKRALAQHLYYDECNENASEVARRMGESNSTIRSYLDEARTVRTNLTQDTANKIKEYVDKNRYVDISEGTNFYLGVSKDRLGNAIALLEKQGYQRQKLYIDQLGTNHKTTMSVLTAPDVDYAELSEHKYDVRFIGQDSSVIDECGDVMALGGGKKPPAISSDRIYIKYNEEGGLDEDGTIYIRPGVPDLSLGGADYAQVRINVDDTHYMKGMARYSNDIPEGYDVVYNSNKHEGTPAKYAEKEGQETVFKKMKTLPDGTVDWTNPFGSGETKQYENNGVLSACNFINRQGVWQDWDRNLPSQFLSKQPVPLAERQLRLAVDDKRRTFEEICALTNPEVKKKFLIDFSEKCDAAAVDLKAAPFPGQQTHVIMPFPELKDNEIYASNYKDGTRVALVRFPHQGKFEIPILTVHNTGSPAAEALKGAQDAVGINRNVADRLSGADFDGDSVLVIPLSDKVKIKNQEPLRGLENFDPKERYPYYPGMKIMTSREKGLEMGKVSNLITDMSLQGASEEHLARATRHALVVIDAEKHMLDWKASEKIEDIDELKRIYQGGGGASTIISKASAEERVPMKKDWYASKNTIDIYGNKIETDALYKANGEKNDAAWTYTAKFKGIPMNDGKLVTVREERKGGEKTGRLYYTEADPSTGKKVRHYVTEADFPEPIDTLKEKRTVYLNRDKKKGGYYYLKTDPTTDKKVRIYVNEDDLDGGIKEEPKLVKSTRMAEAKDAYELTMGGSKENVKYKMEAVYADFANDMKDLARQARKEWVATATYTRDPEAAKTYAAEVKSLNDKLVAVKRNAPVERQAQLLGNRHVAMAKERNPDMSDEKIKKLKGRMITAARKVLNESGQKSEKIKFTDREVEAIQKNAISASKLRDIMDHADTDDLRAKFTPRTRATVTPAMEALAKSMHASGYTYAQIEERLGISTTTIGHLVNKKDE